MQGSAGIWLLAHVQRVDGLVASRNQNLRENRMADVPSSLLDRHALGEVARLIDVAAELDGEVIGEELERDDGEDRARGNRGRAGW